MQQMAEKTLPLPMERSIMFAKQVTQTSIEEVSKRILEINADDRHLEKLYPLYGLNYTPPPIEIFIDSYGGLVYQVNGLLAIMEKSKTEIHTICTGAAMSCGFMMLIFGHKRFAYAYATPLYHQISTSFWGTVKEGEHEMKETKRLQKLFENMVIRKTKITAKKLKQVYDGKVDWFMTAKEAKKLGVVDEII